MRAAHALSLSSGFPLEPEWPHRRHGDATGGAEGLRPARGGRSARLCDLTGAFRRPRLGPAALSGVASAAWRTSSRGTWCFASRPRRAACASHRGRRRPVPDAVALRAVRPEPDVPLRYGTVPVVRATGGLADTVRGVRSASRARATASCSTNFSADEMVMALRRALAAHAEPELWRTVQRTAWRAIPAGGWPPTATTGCTPKRRSASRVVACRVWRACGIRSSEGLSCPRALSPACAGRWGRRD